MTTIRSLRFSPYLNPRVYLTGPGVRIRSIAVYSEVTQCGTPRFRGESKASIGLCSNSSRQAKWAQAQTQCDKAGPILISLYFEENAFYIKTLAVRCRIARPRGRYVLLLVHTLQDAGIPSLTRVGKGELRSVFYRARGTWARTVIADDFGCVRKNIVSFISTLREKTGLVQAAIL